MSLTNRGRVRFCPIYSWLAVYGKKSLQVDISKLFVNDFSLWLKPIELRPRAASQFPQAVVVKYLTNKHHKWVNDLICKAIPYDQLK